MTALIADWPTGDGPKRTHIHLRFAIARIAHRVAIRALCAGHTDVLAEVYAAGISHAVELLTKSESKLP